MKLQHNRLTVNAPWFGATSDIAFLLIIFFIISTTFSYSNSILFKNKSSDQINSSNDTVKIVKLLNDGRVLIENKTYSIIKIKNILKKNKKYIIETDKKVIYQQFINLIDIFIQNKIYTFELR